MALQVRSCLQHLAAQEGDQEAPLFALLRTCETHGPAAHALAFCGMLEALAYDGPKEAAQKCLCALIDVTHARPYFAELLRTAVIDKQLLTGDQRGGKVSIEAFASRCCVYLEHKLALATALLELKHYAGVQPWVQAFGKKLLFECAATLDSSSGPDNLNQKLARLSPLVLHKALVLLLATEGSGSGEAAAALQKLFLAASKALSRREKLWALREKPLYLSHRISIEGVGDASTFYDSWELLGSLVHSHEKQQETSRVGPQGLQNLKPKTSLAGIMEEQGFACTSTAGVFQKVLNMVPKIDERSAAHVIGLVSGCGGVRSPQYVVTESADGLAALLGSSLSLDRGSGDSNRKPQGEYHSIGRHVC